MASIGRNDPCPCGSGRKYKRCCLAATTSVIETPSQEDRELVYQVLDESVGAARYQADLAAVSPLLADRDTSVLDDDEIMASRVVDWMTLDVVLRRGGTIAADTLRRRTTELPAGARRFLRDLMAAPLRLMQVDLNLHDDVVWRDLIDEDRTYQMSWENESFAEGEVLVARIVEREGLWLAEDPPSMLCLDDVEETAEGLHQSRHTALAEGATTDVVRMLMGAALLRLVASAGVADDPAETPEGDPVCPTDQHLGRRGDPRARGATGRGGRFQAPRRCARAGAGGRPVGVVGSRPRRRGRGPRAVGGIDPAAGPARDERGEPRTGRAPEGSPRRVGRGPHPLHRRAVGDAGRFGRAGRSVRRDGNGGGERP